MHQVMLAYQCSHNSQMSQKEAEAVEERLPASVSDHASWSLFTCREEGNFASDQAEVDNDTFEIIELFYFNEDVQTRPDDTKQDTTTVDRQL